MYSYEVLLISQDRTVSLKACKQFRWIRFSNFELAAARRYIFKPTAWIKIQVMIPTPQSNTQQSSVGCTCCWRRLECLPAPLMKCTCAACPTEPCQVVSVLVPKGWLSVCTSCRAGQVPRARPIRMTCCETVSPVSAQGTNCI